MKIIGIIPARFASSRFPGKPLVDMLGQTMIERVYYQVKKSKRLHKIVVATDDQRIFDHIVSFGGNAVITREDHPSGTDRCFEALQKQNEKFDFAINIQGDEPFIDPAQIDLLCASITMQTELATLIQKIATREQLHSAGEAKVVVNHQGDAIYFSRSPIPFVQKAEPKDWLNQTTFYRHVGLYAYRSDILEKITKLAPSLLEKAESLEQLRWIENGFKIKTVETEMEESICIDTPEDLQRALVILRQQETGR
ncbi:MAG: 3-deoxy-manno-octulosonate cytidylyltransferase [Bacteroidetes bacterium]|nr:3-deoxy-manno-octulosonate cytidylyltransferase [Bacteroidota bacterium]MBS1541668.1 3-deoxy-manno-octulosonate cytidylyltransferase [Bacteroidota bacterium]